MQRSDLHVIAVIFNPIRWERRVKLYKQFEQHMLDSGVSLTLVECALGNRPHVLGGMEHVNYIPVRCRTLAWNKESLVRIGVSRLPPGAKNVFWIDADVEFENDNWVMDSLHALEQYPVIQPWSEALDLGPEGSPMFIKGSHVQTSFCKVWRQNGEILLPPYAYAHPGYAWGMRRSTWDAMGGLIDTSGLGAGDHQMAMAMVGKTAYSIHGETTEDYQRPIKAWGARADIHIAGRLGFCQGLIKHFFHGAKVKRQYNGRWQILIKHKFSPSTDLTVNSYGVVEFAGNKPGLEHDVDIYYRSRGEDDNVVGYEGE